MPYLDAITDLQVDLLAQAMACGLTRFATLLLNELGKEMLIDGLTLPVDVHNDIAHRYSSEVVRLGRVNRYYYGKIARLLRRLDEGGALDSTLIMATSDMGNPSTHSVRNLPLILAGGPSSGELKGPSGAVLKLGRRLKAPADCPASNQYCTAPTLTLRPHNQVLVSLCKLFGVETNTFGFAENPALITGAYPALLW